MLAMVYRGPYKIRAKKRADLTHQPLDPIPVAGPWPLAGGTAYSAVKALRKRRR